MRYNLTRAERHTQKQRRTFHRWLVKNRRELLQEYAGLCAIWGTRFDYQWAFNHNTRWLLRIRPHRKAWGR